MSAMSREHLRKYGIFIEMAKRAIPELGLEVLKISSQREPISKLTLALAMATLSSRIHQDGLSSREMWT